MKIIIFAITAISIFVILNVLWKLIIDRMTDKGYLDFLKKPYHIDQNHGDTPFRKLSAVIVSFILITFGRFTIMIFAAVAILIAIFVKGFFN